MTQRQHGTKLIDTIRKFLWPIGVFRDASRGNQFERAAAYRHNRRARGCLPHYMNNCLVAGIALAVAGACLENTHNLVASILCWILLTYPISVLAVLSAVYLGLTAWDT